MIYQCIDTLFEYEIFIEIRKFSENFNILLMLLWLELELEFEEQFSVKDRNGNGYRQRLQTASEWSWLRQLLSTFWYR